MLKAGETKAEAYEDLVETPKRGVQSEASIHVHETISHLGLALPYSPSAWHGAWHTVGAHRVATGWRDEWM